MSGDTSRTIHSKTNESNCLPKNVSLSKSINEYVDTKSLAKGANIPFSKTLKATKTPERNTQRIPVMNNSALGPKAALTISIYVADPVLRAQLQRMYRLKSVITAENIIISVASTIPAFANASGMESTPPPTIVATRLNVPKKRFVLRRGESDGGFKNSSDSFRWKIVNDSWEIAQACLLSCGGMMIVWIL